MPYRLKKEPVPDAIKRIVQEEIDSACELLTSRQEHRDRAIHEARKSLKKIRAVLRLMRPELGATYTRENRRFRDLGRALSTVRDAVAVIEVFDGLADDYKDRIQPAALEKIRKGLNQHKETVESSLDLDQLAKKTVSALRAASRRLASWPLHQDGFAAVSGGLHSTYRRGRKALAKAKAEPTPERYHFLRKRVKDHWYHVRLLENIWTESMRAREATLKEIETWLGDDHNLVVLRDMMRKGDSHFGNREDIEFMSPVLEHVQKELRQKAISFAERVYEQKPRLFTEEIERLWDNWQSEPRAAKQVEREKRQKRAS
jgi:CHAD domain-containing protein